METSEPTSVTGFPLKRAEFSGIPQKELGRLCPFLSREHVEV